MTYTPINWQTGDTITAEKMNKMDNGWGVESTQLFSETVTAAAGQYGNYGTLVYATQVDAPSVIVTFDGTDYTCNAVVLGGITYYGGISGGGPDFSEYPFAIESAVSAGGPNGVYTQTAGDHTIAVAVSSLQTSADFAAAVSSIVLPIIPTLQIVQNQTTWQQVYDALSSGNIAYCNIENNNRVDSYIANSAYFDDTDNRYRIFANNASMTFSASSANGALVAD